MSETVAKPAEPPVLQVRGLRVELQRGHRRVMLVRGADLDLYPREILGLVGESGGGKSLMGAAMTGLIDPPLYRISGEIMFDGQRIDTMSRRQMADLRGRGIGMIFQDPLTSLNPVFTVGNQLIETIERHTNLRGAAARDEAIALLDQVGIPGAGSRIDSYPHEFSGGMRQRVVIALALAGRPKVIIADEPTTALDVSIQAQILQLLHRLCRERGTAIVLITHDMGVIATTAHRVAVMYAGRIVEVGQTADVLARARHPYTSGLMRSIPEVGLRQRRLPQLPGAMPRPDALPAGCAFHPRCALASEACAKFRPALGGPAAHLAACFHSDRLTPAIAHPTGARP